ncbi:MAG: ferrous iron transport protein A [Clostridia bacterium]|nr:ferrous iron transport protein A [Clostridia bacterium]
MQKEYFLSELLPKQRATVKQILSHNTMKRRLQDLGFVKGSFVECVFSASSGDPICYRVGETLLALRKQDADTILVTKGRYFYEK